MEADATQPDDETPAACVALARIVRTEAQLVESISDDATLRILLTGVARRLAPLVAEVLAEDKAETDRIVREIVSAAFAKEPV